MNKIEKLFFNHVRAPTLASAIGPTHVCDRTYTRVKSGSHASKVLITRVSHASVNYVASEYVCSIYSYMDGAMMEWRPMCLWGGQIVALALFHRRYRI